MDYLDFVELVVRQNVRPERPEDEDAPGLSDEIWALAEACWVKDPRKRPIASALCDALSDVRSPPSDVTNDPSLGSPKYPDHRLVQTGDEVVIPEWRSPGEGRSGGGRSSTHEPEMVTDPVNGVPIPYPDANISIGLSYSRQTPLIYQFP
jgi:hypothetical protein